MQEYRAYIMGPDGHVQKRVDLRSNDEDEAIGVARQLVDGHDVELWQLDRQIRTFKAVPKEGEAARRRSISRTAPCRPLLSHLHRGRT
jgi:hypothetical protein